MWILTLLALFTLAKANVIPETCDVKINNECYKKEILNNIDRAYLLKLDNYTNTLYFSRNKDGKEENAGIFVSSYFNLDDKEVYNINEEVVENGFAQAIDYETHDVYIGGENGIFKFDHKTKTVEEFAAKGVNIWNLYYFEDDLYYITFPENFLYVCDNKNKNTVRFKDLEDVKVECLVIDRDNDIIYTNDTGVFKQKKGTKNASSIKGASDGTRALTTNMDGIIYLCGVNGIFVFDKDNNSIEQKVENVNCYGITFDNENNMIYSDDSEIVRLVRNKLL